jgi:hypothetical protein
MGQSQYEVCTGTHSATVNAKHQDMGLARGVE